MDRMPHDHDRTQPKDDDKSSDSDLSAHNDALSDVSDPVFRWLKRAV